MENSAKVTALWLAAVFTSCHSREEKFLASLSVVGIEDSVLFEDRSKRIFIRLPYREVHEDETFDKKYSYIEHMYPYGDSANYHPLKDVVHVPTFKRVKNTSNYWQDKHYIYTDPWVPYPGQTFFSIVGRVGEVKFLHNPDFARVNNYLYYRGVHVPGDTVPKAGHYP